MPDGALLGASRLECAGQKRRQRRTWSNAEVASSGPGRGSSGILSGTPDCVIGRLHVGFSRRAEELARYVVPLRHGLAVVLTLVCGLLILQFETRRSKAQTSQMKKGLFVYANWYG